MTKKNLPSLAEQRQLLNLRADSLRLKILATQIKNRHEHPKPLQYWNIIMSFVEMLPLSGLVLKLSSKPKRWRNKLLLAGFFLSLTWLIQKFKLSTLARNR